MEGIRRENKGQRKGYGGTWERREIEGKGEEMGGKERKWR